MIISNYATSRVVDVLNRINGIGSITVFGGRDYSMRVWLDPIACSRSGSPPGTSSRALQAQNVQVASGVLSQPPVDQPRAFQVAVQTLGRLADPAEFANILVKQTADGRGAPEGCGPGGAGRPSTTPPTPISTAIPPSRSASSSCRARTRWRRRKRPDHDGRARQGLSRRGSSTRSSTIRPIHPADPSNAVVETIVEAVILVVLVVILFLQTWRAAVIPIIAIPVSLIGTFFFMAIFGFSLNNLSLFGLVLAIGIVVDDAIVVVENVERNIAAGLSPREAARKSMDEVGSALIAIALVLCAVFVPAAFITGITGQFYRQFALTIAGATVISLIVSLTLSPAMCALLLKPHTDNHSPTSSLDAARAWLLQTVQSGVRQASARLWLAQRAPRARRRTDARCLRGRHRLRPQRIPQDAGRLYSAARFRLPDRGDAAAERRLAGPDRRGQQAGRRHRLEDTGRRPRREFRRLLGCHLHQRTELGRDLPSPRAVRGARPRPQASPLPPSRVRCSSASPRFRRRWSWW